MNILLVFPLYCHHSGGHRNAALGVVRSLLGAEVQVSAISPLPPNGEMPPESPTIEDCRLDQIYYLKNAEGVETIAAGYDCAIVWDYKDLSLEMVKVFLQLHLPYCYFSGGVLHYRNLLHWMKKFVFCNFLSPVFRNASGIVLPTLREHRRLKCLLPMYRGKAAHVLHEVSTTTRKNAVKPHEVFRLGFLGRLDIKHKGLDILIGAVALAKDSCPNIRLELAGPDFQNNRALLEQQAASLGIKELVEFTGPVYGDAKQEFFNRTDLFVHLCRWEAFGIGIIEAMLSGTPVLLSNKANLAEELDYAKACCTTTLSPDDVAKKISILACERDRLKQYACTGYDWASRNCSAHAVSYKLMLVLNAICPDK